MPNYTIGTIDPSLTADAGAGVWKSVSPTTEMWLKKQAIYGILPHAFSFIGFDASINMSHYLGNTGNDLTLNLEKMVNDITGEKELYQKELLRAMQFVQTLPLGVHNITSTSTLNGYAEKSESWNWFFATGGYTLWGKGIAKVTSGKDDFFYELDFEYKFYDRYNWDGGKQVTILKIVITDEFMGRFHREGYAKEFNMYGSMKRNIKWAGKTFAKPVITDPGGR
jgi:hypothetical protein